MGNQSVLSMSAKSGHSGQHAQDRKKSDVAHDKDIEEFEELSESREIIEDRIFRLKLQMIDLTIH